MVVQIEIGQVEITVLQNHQDAVILVELTQQFAVLVVVQAVHIGVEPHLATAQSGVSVALQTDAVHRILSQQVTFRGSSLNHNLREVFLNENLLELRIGVKRNLDNLSLAVWISRKVENP